MDFNLNKCSLCPRNCGIDRNKSIGYCGQSDRIKVARSALHMWEEPCISGKSGSGAIFFSGCSLKCVFCQNNRISHQNFGKEITVQQLSKMMLSLKEQGASNINLVTPTQFVLQIKEALKGIKSQLAIPVIYNSSGYENKETIASLKGYVDVFLPDYKYKSKFLSRKLSNAPDYPQMAQESIEEMIKITGPCCFSSDGMIEKGTIIRHLVLPGFLENTFSVLSDIENSFKDKGVLISLMSQYTPDFYEGEIESLKHSLTSAEYNKAVNYACDLGLGGFMQELSSSDKKFTPSFNLEGVE